MKLIHTKGPYKLGQEMVELACMASRLLQFFVVLVHSLDEKSVIGNEITDYKYASTSQFHNKASCLKHAA